MKYKWDFVQSKIQNMCNLTDVTFEPNPKTELFPLHSHQALFGETENVNEERVNEGRVGEIGFNLTLTRREDK